MTPPAVLSPRVELTESVFTMGVRTGYDDVVPVFGNYVPVAPPAGCSAGRA